MKLSRVLAVTRREWTDFRRNPGLMRGFLVMPALFGTLSILLGLQATRHSGALLYSDVVLMVYLTMPTTLPTIFAAHSIAGEKVARTLEPVLATPLRPAELVLGKMLMILLAGVFPAFAALTAFVLVMFWGVPPDIFQILCAPRVIFSVVVLAPPIAVMAICIGMSFSMRAPDTQSAQSWAGIITLPVLGLLVTPILGMTMTIPTALGIGGVILVLDVAAVAWVISTCKRDALLTRWS